MLENKPINQKVTIVGTGQVGMTIAALMAKKNKELKIEAEQEQDIEKKRALESKIIEISILGRSENSDSYKDLKKNGITLNFKNPQDNNLVVKIDPSEFKIITANPEDIKEQDHIFVTTKSYSHSIEFFKKLNGLKKIDPSKHQDTTIILAQNGIPCWFLSCSRLNQNVSLEKVDSHNKIFRTIGSDSIIGCVVNFACNSEVNEDGNIEFNISTPINKISLPIGRPDQDTSWDNLKNLQSILRTAGILFAVRKGISEELWLKLQINHAINALTTLYNCNIGTLLDDPNLRQVLEKIANEVADVAKEVVVGNIDLRKGEMLDNRLNPSRDHITSMRSDFIKGNPLETAVYEAVLELESLLTTKTKLTPTIFEITELLQSAIEKRIQLGPEGAISDIRQKVDGFIDRNVAMYRPATPPLTSPIRSEGSIGSYGDGEESVNKKRRVQGKPPSSSKPSGATGLIDKTTSKSIGDDTSQQTRR
jgi:ketopantoate reductase